MADQQDAKSDYDHFASIPWCSQHLRGSRTIASTPECRSLKSDGEDALYADTLKSQATIAAMLVVYDEPASPTDRVNSVKGLFTLGPGLNGYAGVCHGGIVVTILDELIGFIIPINQKRGFMPDAPYMTAYINTTFLKPVPTGATILGQVKISRLEGRKYYSEAWLEDKDGAVLARAESLFIAIRSAL